MSIPDEREVELLRLREATQGRGGVGEIALRRREELLQGAAGGGGFPSCGPEQWGPVVKPTPEQFFYNHGDDREMRFDALYERGYLVPNELFFVRNQCPTPYIDPATWRLQVTGAGISQPLSLAYDELTTLPSISVIRALECAGNGRQLMARAIQKPISGTQWRLGAIGVAEWTGVPLREVLERAGVKKTAVDLMAISLDRDRVQRPIPIQKALENDTLLVYAMNGQVLPPDHGFPVRLLVPGWVGAANIKWLGELEITTEPAWSYWNTRKYILYGGDHEPVGPAWGPPLCELNVKSAFELEWGASLPAGRRLLRGRSWSARGTVERVEVSFDRGGSWHLASLREPNLPQAWVRWDVEWVARPGDHNLRVRAVDSTGLTQPEEFPFNQGGYLFNGVYDHPVTIR